MESSVFSISDMIYRLPPAAKATLDEQIIVRRVAKGEWVFAPDKLDHTIYYVAEGLLRKYMLTDEKEKTLDFYFTDEIYFPAVAVDRPTGAWLQAIEPSTVFQLRLENFEKIKNQWPELARLEIQILETAYRQTQERLFRFQTMNATERYLSLLEKSPEIIRRIPLLYVASYLGINNASLSKIRATLK